MIEYRNVYDSTDAVSYPHDTLALALEEVALVADTNRWRGAYLGTMRLMTGPDGKLTCEMVCLPPLNTAEVTSSLLADAKVRA